MFGQSSGFGQQSTAQTTGFGQTGFGQPTSTTGFGQTAPTTGFGQSAPTAGFGQTTPATGFGQTAPATGFGQSTSTTGFGQPTATAGFGQTNNASTQNNSGFGATNTGFGKTNTSFGQSASGFGTSNTGFGQTGNTFGQTSSAFGQSTSGFGTTNSGFGQTSSAFGQNASGFGTSSAATSQATSAFGQTTGFGTNNTGFGQTSSSFGQNTSGFGATNSAFGQTSSAFKQTAPSFGQTGTGFGLNNSGFGAQNKTGFGNTAIFGASTGTANTLLSGNTANNQALKPAVSAMDQRINHFLTVKSDSNVDQLPPEAQKLLSEIQQSLLTKKRALSSLRTQMQTVENELQSNCTEISEVIIGTVNVDLLLKSGVDKLEQLEQRQLSSSDLIPVKTLLQVAQKGCSPNTFDNSVKDVLKNLNSEVSFQALQYESAIKKLDVASNNLQCLAKLDQTDGLKSFIGAQHLHMCELSSRAKEAMERSQKAISSCAGSRVYETLKGESHPRSLISSLYASHDFNFDPTLFEIACEDLEPHS